MARFLIGTMPGFGHVNPALPIASKLVERGHEVWWYTGKLFQSRVEATGARYVPMVAGLDHSEWKNTMPESLREKRERLSDVAQLNFDLKHFVIDGAVGIVKDYEDILRQFPADVLLSDDPFIAASWVHERGGPPWASLGLAELLISSRDTAPFGLGIQPDSSPLGRLRNGVLNWVFDQVLMRDLTVHMNTIRASLGLPPIQKSFFDVTLSPFLQLQGTVPGFEYPRSDLPPQVHFVGPLLPSPPANFTFPTWWDQLKGNRPVILATQGTVANDKPENLIVPTLQALANEDVLVIAMTGGTPIKLAQYPPNAIIEQEYIPFSHLLPHVDIMVSNGGSGGVHMGLANGVPLVVAGQTDGKSETCARVQWSAVGIDLKTNNPKPKQIKDAVKKILTSSQYRQKAKLLQAEIACYDAPTLAATLLEQLVATQQPVLRTQQTVTQEFELTAIFR